ncbi:carboxymethylenebutenolidase [Azorhizobium oxalatiphilum]|uniref:Carboxymethylenebutenolidase n=1 Tax=Azorhizobium oxalatiphilum TaxID=980631 RepID=A0A917C2R8_9HYPH|nr:dienelactone hydrolase family protein [Azorhizobium oxalatiphilum]GGF67276.1 carboxymethylenebutenolidase [Azorhizobium oxalatiphilum]
MMNLTAADGHTLSAYQAEPAEAPKGAVVIVHDMFGLTPDMIRTADDLAAQGYLTLAPALFDRAAPGTVLSYDEEGFARGLALIEQIGREPALNDIQAAVEAASPAGKVAVIGFSWGGGLAYEAANRLRGAACVVGFCPLGVLQSGAEKRRVPTLLHFGASDPLLPATLVQPFRDLRPDVSAFSYAGATHGFTSRDRATLHVGAREQAFARTQTFIAQYVEGVSPAVLKNAGAYAQAKTERRKGGAAKEEAGPPA